MGSNISPRGKKSSQIEEKTPLLMKNINTQHHVYTSRGNEFLNSMNHFQFKSSHLGALAKPRFFWAAHQRSSQSRCITQLLISERNIQRESMHIYEAIFWTSSLKEFLFVRDQNLSLLCLLHCHPSTHIEHLFCAIWFAVVPFYSGQVAGMIFCTKRMSFLDASYQCTVNFPSPYQHKL